ncbi:MAG: DUF1559 domain-containing protein [Thermoguttaceae bacterium]|jgi:prepilin-type N-terminal cleavage/methylation domain-containing protein
MGTKRLAFTLVELLVVIAIIGILIGLLLPAINSAREAGRRAQCENNLKQLALAVLAYENAEGIFPPSCTFTNGPSNVKGGDPENISGGKDNWVIKILPYMEYNELYTKFDHDKPTSDASNKVARGTEVREMLCPSDTFNRKPFMGSTGEETKVMGDNWARGNYAANGSLAFLSISRGSFDAGGNTPEWRDPRLRGMMGQGVAVTHSQVTDGLSHTVMLAEMRTGLTPYDTRGVWAMSGACPSSLWATAYFVGDDYGPNCATPAADDMVSCEQLQQAMGGVDAVVEAGMSCSSGPWPNWQQTARSNHAGGVYCAFGDGGIHLLSDLVNCAPSTITNPSVWDMLMASGDGQTVPPDAYE